MSPSRAELARFGSLLEAGAAPIGGYAEQDFLNWRFQVGGVGGAHRTRALASWMACELRNRR